MVNIKKLANQIDERRLKFAEIQNKFEREFNSMVKNNAADSVENVEKQNQQVSFLCLKNFYLHVFEIFFYT